MRAHRSALDGPLIVNRPASVLHPRTTTAARQTATACWTRLSRFRASNEAHLRMTHEPASLSPRSTCSSIDRRCMWLVTGGARANSARAAPTKLGVFRPRSTCGRRLPLPSDRRLERQSRRDDRVGDIGEVSEVVGPEAFRAGERSAFGVHWCADLRDGRLRGSGPALPSGQDQSERAPIRHHSSRRSPIGRSLGDGRCRAALQFGGAAARELWRSDGLATAS